MRCCRGRRTGPRLPHAVVDRSAETEILMIAEKLEVQLLGRAAQLLDDGGILRAVVHDDELHS